MINQIFTVYDEKAHAYLPPFYFNQIGQATRVFTDCINSKDHQFGNHPSDYTLFHVGDYDDNTAEFHTHAPNSLGNGVEFVDSPQPENPDADQIRNEAFVPAATNSGNKSV